MSSKGVVLQPVFKRLVSNLPYNPGLISQVSFYAHRIRKEQFIRRIGFAFMAITMVVQTLVFITPPERSLAASSNHIINGIKTRDDILQAWDQLNSDIPAIYGAFGLTRDDIAKLPQSPNDKIKSTDADYWTIGRNSLTGYSGVNEDFKNAQLSLQYAGKDSDSTVDDMFVYQRPLKAWDVQNPSNSYQAFKGTIASTGEQFWIIVDCGNFTKIGRSTPPATADTPKPTPRLEIKKSIENRPDFVSPGDTLRYVISFRNATPDTLAEGVYIEDQFDTRLFNLPNVETENYSITNGFLRNNQGGLPYTTDFQTITIDAPLNDQLTSGSAICNEARITATNAAAITSNPACVGVITKCPFNTPVESNNPNCVDPKIVCSIYNIGVDPTTRLIEFRTSAGTSSVYGTTITSYSYDFGDGSALQTIASDSLVNTATHTYPSSPSPYTVTATVHYRTINQETGEDQHVDCTIPIDLAYYENPLIGQHKEVKNITQNTEDELAEELTVNSGDTLEYTIVSSNPDDYVKDDVEVSEYIGDILDYAVLDEQHLKEHGGTYHKDTKKIVWDDEEIKPNAKVEHTYKVTVKDPIPSTNQPTALGTTNDCKMSSQYGNEITINVDCPFVKTIETLPNTGPGSSMFFSVIVTTVVGYFYARSRLLGRELNLIRADYSGGPA